MRLILDTLVLSVPGAGLGVVTPPDSAVVHIQYGKGSLVHWSGKVQDL